MPSLIVLLTDFGLEDEYVGTMKGVITGINPKAQIFDLCHNVAPQDIFEGAYILYSSYKYFPPKTVFVVVVDPGVGSERRIICLRTKSHTFLAPNNGILGLVLTKERPTFLVDVSNKKYFLPEVSATFHGRDIFAPVAAHLSLGLNPSKLGERLEKIKEIALPRPMQLPGGILRGEVIHVDRFGNLITNINHGLVSGIPEILSITVGDNKIYRLSRSYQDGRPGDLLALFGSSGHLEIAINQGSAKERLNVSRGEKVTIGCQPAG